MAPEKHNGGMPEKPGRRKQELYGIIAEWILKDLAPQIGGSVRIG